MQSSALLAKEAPPRAAPWRQPTDGGLAPNQTDTQRADTRPRVAGVVTVEVAAGPRLAEIQFEWHDLVARADTPNVFMHPTFVALGACHAGTHSPVLLAWHDDGSRRRLVGYWAFARGRARRALLPVLVLASPPFVHAYLATPVIDREWLDQALESMLDHIAADASLPKIVALDAVHEDGATVRALRRLLAARGAPARILRRSQRPILSSKLDATQYMEKAFSGATRKKLRQRRRRLGEKGALESKIVKEPEAVALALEDFLRIEAAGWKGGKGTALLCNTTDAAFARESVPALAAEGDAWIHALYLEGQPVSMQVVLRSGATAFTWKTAYDESLQDFSPGMLLLEDYTAAFLSDPAISAVDSCAYDDSGFMAAWCERQPMAEVSFDVRRGGSIVFTLFSQSQKAYLRLRAQAKACLAAMRRRRR